MKIIRNLTVIGLTLFLFNCTTKDDSSTENNRNLTFLALAASQSSTVPAVVDCQVTTSAGPTTTTATRKLFTAVSTPQTMFDSVSGTESSTSLYIKVTASADDTKLGLTNWGQLGTGSRMVTVFKGSSCPLDTTASSAATVKGTDYTDDSSTSDTLRTIVFKKGDYIIQLYTGSGTETPGAPSPLSSSRTKPTMNLL